MKDSVILWTIAASFVAGTLLGFTVTACLHRNYHEIIKTSIGEIILKNGKVYTVYEMQRTANGDMVAK